MQRTDLTTSLFHLNLGSTLTFLLPSFLCRKLIPLIFFFLRQFQLFSFGFLFESVVSNYLVSMPARLICCVMCQIFEEVHGWTCLYLNEKLLNSSNFFFFLLVPSRSVCNFLASGNRPVKNMAAWQWRPFVYKFTLFRNTLSDSAIVWTNMCCWSRIIWFAIRQLAK